MIYLIIPKLGDRTSKNEARLFGLSASQKCWLVRSAAKKEKEETCSPPDLSADGDAVVVFSNVLCSTDGEAKKACNDQLVKFIDANKANLTIFFHAGGANKTEEGVQKAINALKELVDDVAADGLKPLYISQGANETFPWSKSFYGENGNEGKISELLKKKKLEDGEFTDLTNLLVAAAGAAKNKLYPLDIPDKSEGDSSRSRIDDLRLMDVLLGMTGTYVALQSLLQEGASIEDLRGNLSINGLNLSEKSVTDYLKEIYPGYKLETLDAWIGRFYTIWNQEKEEGARQALSGIVLILFGIRALSQAVTGGGGDKKDQ